ncbi:hypothetical protein [Lysinibacillus sp. SGAir0095]|uniref:hypothetical protein n=1 Tax=Lysinibacillus sp. SGAir0095 TaxID=2070463 RepID=UPI0010CD5A48|nr:hypothetical protein [Lysinibacillus sp. SGAir0095]QCR32247.1 hypothetical protein C1N55_08705 [Lysinibacillus sp. SGAir0095]
MDQPRNFPKVASDMFFVQGIWASGFLGIMLIIQIIKTVMSSINGNEVNTYFVATFIASNIFMLVIGIISAYGFIPHFVSNGVTRKDYFIGTIFGTIGLALSIPIVSAIITSISKLIINLLNLQVTIGSFENRVTESDDHIIADLVTSVIFSPYIELSSSWLLAILVFALNIFTYYVAGWLIGAAFSRLGIIGGILSIIIGFIVIQTEDILLSTSLGLNVPSFALTIELPSIVSIMVILIIIALCLWIIRQLTKRMRVKF